MDERLIFGSREYCIYLSLLLFSRGMDFLSTWVGSPNLLLEGNPISKKLRWSGALALNLVVSIGLALWPLPAIIVCTISALLAARNFSLAWIMRAIGEEGYRAWMLARLDETPASVFLFCVLGQGVLTGAVGVFLVGFSDRQLVPLGVGAGLVGYAIAVVLYTLFALWRNRHAARTR